MTVSYDDDLRLAHVLADAVERVTMARFRAEDLMVETKPDLTPVSDADRAAEELIRHQLARTRPRDAVVGEEFGTTGHGPRRWIVDPIDGTKNFVRGGPASLSYASLGGWSEIDRREDFLDLMDGCWRTRAYGDFWSYMLVAEGVVDIAAEPSLQTYDMAALVPIVTEAGGRFTGLDGRPGCWSGNAVATNGLLHETVLDLIGD